MSNTVKIYKDGYDLYLTKQKFGLREGNFESYIGEYRTLSDALSEADLQAERSDAEYIWVDIALTNGKQLNPNVGMFTVVNGHIIELDGGAIC